MKNIPVAMLSMTLMLPAVSALAQSKPAEYHSAAALKQDLDKLASQAKAKNAGSSGSDLSTTDTHALKLSYRRETGGAEVHQHFDDIMVVEGGSATIVTGGSLV